MADAVLRGHHVKNLRFELYSREHDGFLARKYNQGSSYDHILDAPPHTIEIVAGSIDSICEKCDGLQSCESEGEIYARSSDLYDRIMAYSSGVRVGETYNSHELIDKLRKQNVHSQDIKDFLATAMYVSIVFPYDVMDTIKPLSEGASVRSRVNKAVSYATFGLFVDSIISPWLTGNSLHENLGMHLPYYADKAEQLLLAAGIVYALTKTKEQKKQENDSNVTSKSISIKKFPDQ